MTLIKSWPWHVKPGDSCINQLLSVTHDIYQSSDNGFEVRVVFLDISKAFDKVWHKGLIYKLKQNGVAGNLLNTLTDVLKDRKQRVVLNGQNSIWVSVEAGVPQGSILGPLLFLIYINELCGNLVLNPKLFQSFLQGWNPLFSEGTPPFLGTPSFWSKFEMLPSSFWGASKLVHINCMKHFKMKELYFVLY